MSDRLADLKRKLRKREGNPAFRENVVDLRAEIARLEAQKEQANG